VQLPGDLTGAVEAQGEVAILKDNINQMIANLGDNPENTEQDWLKTNQPSLPSMLRSIDPV